MAVALPGRQRRGAIHRLCPSAPGSTTPITRSRRDRRRGDRNGGHQNEPAQVTALRQRLDGRALDILFVNAGITTKDEHTTIGDVTTDEFNTVMLTNALSPMRVIESVQDLVTPTGLIGAMSSGQGSIANNETGRREVYRSSKAALNQLMRGFAVRQPEPKRTLLVMAPGWIRTDLGGPDAPLTIEDSIPKLVNVMLAQLGTPGVRFLDYQGRNVPW